MRNSRYSLQKDCELQMANRLLMFALLGLALTCGDGEAAARLTLGSDNLPNHALVSLDQVGSSQNGGNSLQCHSDLDSCCNGDGAGGNWFTPDNERLTSAGSVYVVPGDKRVDLRRGDSGSVVPGIYRCEIDTVATGAGASVRESLYVGLYPNGGGRARIEGGVVSLAVGRDSRSGYAQFTLTCISTGGPSTTVSWVRESSVVNGGKKTVLDDPVTARYIHTLTISRRLGNRYRCIVNNLAGRVEASFVQDSVLRVAGVSTTATTASISWTVTDGVTPANFSISYSNANNTACFRSSEVITDIPANETSYTLTGLQPGTQYSIRVSAVLSSLVNFSKSITTTTDSTAPSAAPTSVAILDTSPTTLGLQWAPPDCLHANGEITGYSVSYGEEGSERRTTLTVHGTSTASLSLLKSSALYVVSVAAINGAGVGPYSDTIAALTTAFDENSFSFDVGSLSPTTATISWTLTLPPSLSATYSLSYSNTLNTHCFTHSASITGLTDNEATLSSLYGATQYSLSVTAALSNGDVLQWMKMFTTSEAVPEAPPVMVGVLDVAPTAITLRWGPVHCNHTNGAVTGYRVRYMEEGSGAEKTLTVSGEGTLEAVVTGLRPGGLYSLRVAAINSAGEGTYSQSVRAATHPTTNSLETSTSPETTGKICTEALVMTGCIGFIVGIVVTLLVSLPTFLFCCRRKLKMSSDGGSSDGPVQEEEEEEKKTNEDMVLSENSAYATTTVISTAAANSYQDMAHSYQDMVIYEHVK